VDCGPEQQQEKDRSERCWAFVTGGSRVAGLPAKIIIIGTTV